MKIIQINEKIKIKFDMIIKNIFILSLKLKKKKKEKEKEIKL